MIKDLAPEIWKDVVGYEGWYQVSNAGAVRNRRDCVLRPQPCRGGYHRVDLSRHGVVCHVLVHVLVTDAFLGPCPPGRERNHINGVKTDNRVANLEYVTKCENELHSYRVLGKRPQQGSSHGRSKLTEGEVAEIRELRRAGNSLLDLARQFSVSAPTISEIANRRIWRHVGEPR
jgi:hypothetical protein